MLAVLGGIALGVALGVRHAFEPDHLTALSTLVVEARGARRGALLGALWGLGHTLSLVAVAGALIATGAVLSERAAAGCELAVALMLIVLGVRSIVRAIRAGARGPLHRHRHHDTEHEHAGAFAHLHLGAHTVAWRPLVVGIVHGLAGSGALTALVLAKLPTVTAQVAYVVLFGFGSTAGMALASGIAAAALANARPRRGLAIVTGALSILVGVAWAVPFA